MKRFLPYVLLALMCGILFCWRLGSTPLIGLDEALYSECSREMLAGGDYIVPTCNGVLFLDKPPLVYWMQAASMRVFGINSFAVRLPSMLAALLLVAFTVYIASRLYDRRSGIMAGFVLASAMLTAGLARMAIMDQIFALAITVSLGAFLLTYFEKWSRKGYLLFWAAMGISTLIKGPVGILLICSIAALFLVLKRDLQSLKSTSPVLGILIFLAIVLPWYVLVQIHTDGKFLQEFFLHQNLQRAMGKDFSHNQPFYFYLPIFVVGFFPWSIFVPLAWRIKVRLSRPDTSLFMAVWMVVIIGFWSLCRSKLPSYIFPMLPAAAVMVGSMWSDISKSAKISSLIRYSGVVLAFSILIAAAFLVGLKFLPEPIPGLGAALTVMGLAIMIGSGIALALARLNKTTAAFGALCCAMTVFMAAAVLVGLPIASQKLSVPAIKMAGQIEKHASNIGRVAAYRLSPELAPAMGFYSGRPVLSMKTPTALRNAVLSSNVKLVVLQKTDSKALPRGGILSGQIGDLVLIKYGKGSACFIKK
jgi:4-amino-4-deoxy-L-arabinose transferase-like glycosyltransferase